MVITRIYIVNPFCNVRVWADSVAPVRNMLSMIREVKHCKRWRVRL